MSLKIDRVQLEILIQQDSARQKMIELEGQMKSASKELSKIKKQFGENSAEYKAQADVVRKLKQQYDDLFDQIGIGHLSLKELANRQRELNTILRNMDPSLPQWREYNEQLQQVNSRIRELRGNANDTGFSLSKLADGFNKYAAMGASVIASMTGMVLTARKCVDEFAQMQEAEAGVIKYTGMTAEEVANLNEEFKKMDTRTPREKLNALAGDAGRLGIKGKEAILEFVDAANTINVALGEDLGDDAVKNIGKLAQMFGDDKTMGLRGAMLATGSAINEVAQNSSAAENFLVDFTARVAGVGNQAGLSQADIIGFAASMDENMMRSETSATAYQKILMKMFTDTEKFAQAADLELEEFTRLVREDANEAMLTFAKALSGKGGLVDLAPIFGDLQTEGAGVAAVLSLMAGRADEIRERQALANEAYREGTSVIKEMNVQNNTVQAGLDKAKHRFKEIRIELGEQLLPVMRYMVSTGSLTVKGLSAIVSFLIEYKSIIASTATAVAAYTLVVNAQTIATKAYELATKAATFATNLFSKATKASPWGLVIAGVSAVISYFTIFKSKTDEETASLKSMNEELERTKSALDRISDIQIKGENLQYLNEDQKKRLRQDTQSAIRELEDMISQEQIVRDSWYATEKAALLKAAGDNEELQERYLKTLDLGLEMRERKIQTYLDKKTELEALLSKLPSGSTLPSSGGSTTSEDTAATSSSENPEEAQRKAMDEWLKTRQEFNDRISDIERNAAKKRLLDGNVDEETYQQEIYDIEMKALFQRKALLESFGMDTTDIQSQIYDNMIEEANRKAEEEKEIEEELNKEKQELRRKGFHDVDKSSNFQEEESLLKAMLDSDLITYEEYQEEMTRIAEEKSQQREDITIASLQTISQAAGAMSDVVNAMQDIEIRKVEAKYDKQIAAAKKAGKDTTKLEEEKEAAVNSIKKKYADKQFMAQVLQVTATTAVTAMEAYKAMAGIPVVGPALGAVAAAAAIAAGAAQIAVAKQTRDEAKGLYSGGYSDEYQEGYTARGNSRDVAGVIPVHKNEFVANHLAVGNPHVKQFLDIFDIAQKNGSIRMLNTTQILEQVRTQNGRYKGGYSYPNSATLSPISASATPEQRLQVVQLLAENNRLLAILCQKELVVDPRQMRDSIKKIETLESNVSRG